VALGLRYFENNNSADFQVGARIRKICFWNHATSWLLVVFNIGGEVIILFFRKRERFPWWTIFRRQAGYYAQRPIKPISGRVL
jgi:hypothetical protein